MLRQAVINAHTEFGENILIGNEDTPPKRILKKRSLAAEFYFRFQRRRRHCSRTVVCVTAQKVHFIITKLQFFREFE